MHPIEIYQPTPDTLEIIWQDGSCSSITTRALRLGCPCSSCQMTTRSATATYVPMLTSEAVTVREINLVGSSAVQIIWADGHDNGLFTYSLIRRLAPPKEPRAA